MKNKNNILVTGSAGFIGFHLCKNLIENGFFVIGIDNLNSYYDVNLKLSRINELENISIINNNFKFIKCDLVDEKNIDLIFNQYNPFTVINLAAQAGVRYSLKNPRSYLDSNIIGFGNILESCRRYYVNHLIFASSSSVYGMNKKIPFCESDQVAHPVSIYAASKRANELMAHSYSHLFNIPITGLRFFTVYGPWGRPDMSYFKFASRIIKGEPIQVFNNGEMMRDFTYIDDVIKSLIKLIKKTPSTNKNFSFSEIDPSSSWAPYRIFNVGNSSPTNLLKFIEIIEFYLGIKAKREYLPMQPGDVKETYANIESLNNWIGYKPFTNIEIGTKKFIDWYMSYYKIK